jgi:acetylornithine deacetylase/succinyl-diaminopimelate desuccinylase-like protein
LVPFSTPTELLDEAMAIFKTLLRFDTSNPPGQEKACADWCVEQLQAAGVTDIKIFDATTDQVVSV